MNPVSLVSKKRGSYHLHITHTKNYTTEKFIYEYDREAVKRKTENSIRNEGKIEGRIKGKKEGISERNIKIAKAMLNKKMDILLISELTGLSTQEITILK